MSVDGAAAHERRRRRALMALLDDAMVGAARARDPSDREVTTVDLHFAFMPPLPEQAGASASVSAGGRSVCFCEAVATDPDGRAVARAIGTLRYRAADTAR